MVEIRVKQCGSCPQLQLVKLQTAKGSLRRPVLGPLNTRYQELGSEPQWQELIASRIQSGQITSVNCQLKWQGQYQGHYEDQLWDYSKGLQVHRNKAHLQPHRETQMTSFQKWEKTFFALRQLKDRGSVSHRWHNWGSGKFRKQCWFTPAGVLAVRPLLVVGVRYDLSSPRC